MFHSIREGLFRPEVYREVTLRSVHRELRNRGEDVHLQEISEWISKNREAQRLLEDSLREQAKNAKHITIGATTAVASAVVASALAAPAFPLAMALALGGTGGGSLYMLWRVFKGLGKRREVAVRIADMFKRKIG